MKLLKILLLGGALLFGLIGLFPGEIRAETTIVAACSNGVLDDNAYLTGVNTVQQLFEVRLDHRKLDSVAVRIKAIDEPAQATAKVIDRGAGVIASANKEIGMDESWVYFDFNDVDMPRAVYFLEITSDVNNPMAWKYSPKRFVY